MRGRAGLAGTRIEGREAIERAWLTTSARWGEGLATEVAREAVRGAFEELGFEPHGLARLSRPPAPAGPPP